MRPVAHVHFEHASFTIWRPRLRMRSLDRLPGATQRCNFQAQISGPTCWWEALCKAVCSTVQKPIKEEQREIPSARRGSCRSRNLMVRHGGCQSARRCYITRWYSHARFRRLCDRRSNAQPGRSRQETRWLSRVPVACCRAAPQKWDGSGQLSGTGGVHWSFEEFRAGCGELANPKEVARC